MDMHVHNSAEDIAVTDVDLRGDTIHIRMPLFDSEFGGIVVNDSTITGRWHNYLKGPEYSILFHAVAGKKARFPGASEPSAHISASWRTHFSAGPPDAYNAIGDFHQVLATSTNGGESWQYRKVNDEPESCATHGFPAMLVDRETHAVHLIWMENRFGEGAVAYARCPGDASVPCGHNEAVSDGPFRFTIGRNPQAWHGDYLGLTLTGMGELWATWSDTRSGNPAMYVAHGRVRP